MVAIMESDQLHSITRTNGAHLAGGGVGLRTSCRTRAVRGREIGILRVAVAHASLARLIVEILVGPHRDVMERKAIKHEAASRRQRLHVK